MTGNRPVKLGTTGPVRLEAPPVVVPDSTEDRCKGTEHVLLLFAAPSSAGLSDLFAVQIAPLLPSRWVQTGFCDTEV